MHPRSLALYMKLGIYKKLQNYVENETELKITNLQFSSYIRES
jgi:hypothetical protein